ncbi:MAG: phage holin family protein [Bacteroidota bacterium]
MEKEKTTTNTETDKMQGNGQSNKAIDRLIDSITGMIETYVELAKLEVRNGLAFSLTYIILATVLIFFLSFSIFFFSLGLAVIINNLSGINYLGYFIIASLYMIFLVLIISQRNNIKARIEMVISERTKNDE